MSNNTDLTYRFQLVGGNFEGDPALALYEVWADSNTEEIVFFDTTGPVVIAGDSIEEVQDILHKALSDIKRYGVVNPDDYKSPDTDDDVPVEKEVKQPIMYDYEDEEFVVDDEFDDEGNVLDLVDFMDKNKW